MSSKRAKASVVPEPSITHHFADFGGSNAGSFEVRHPGGRKFFYYDDNAGRRAIGRHMTKEQALAAAQAFLNQFAITSITPLADLPDFRGTVGAHANHR